MKQFDIKVDINPVTFMDEFTLCIIEDKQRRGEVNLDTCELLDLYETVKHAVETNII